MTTNPNTIIGFSEFRNKNRTISLSETDRFRHTYTIGKTGTGKSTLYQNMIWQDIHAGRGCCFVDPHGEAIDWILERIPPDRLEDVVLFDPSDSAWPIGLNLLEWHQPEEKDFLVAEAIQIFYKIFDPQASGVIGPQFEHWMRNAALTVMSDPAGGTLIDIPRLFTDPEFEQQKRHHITDKTVRSFWEQQMSKTSQFHRSEMLNYFTSKFGRFASNELIRNIIGQRQSSLSLDDITINKKIFLVNLSKGKIGETNAHMLGLILMTKLLIAIMRRSNQDPTTRQPFFLYVDEFQNVMTDAFISMLAEARKYRLGVHLANQYIAQLTDDIREAVIGNAATLFVFQIGSQDTTHLLRELDAKDQAATGLKEESLQYLPRYQFYARMTINGTTHPATRLKSFGPVDYKTSITAGDIKNFSRLSYAMPKSIVSNMV